MKLTKSWSVTLVAVMMLLGLWLGGIGFAHARAGNALPVLFEPDVPDTNRDPEHLSLAGSWPFGRARDVVLDESRNLALVSSGGAVLVLDVTAPVSPTLISDALHTLGVVEDLHYDATTQLLYVAAGEGGMEIWDLQTPSVPQQLCVLEVMFGGVEAPVLSVAVQGDMAYVAADWGGIHWIDVSDPTNPVQVGADDFWVHPVDLVVYGDDVYAAGNFGVFHDSVAWYDIQPDGSLIFQTALDLDVCTNVHAMSSYVYVGCSNASPDPTLYILNANFSQVVSTYPIYTRSVLVSGDYAYVASGSAGFYVLDVSDPGNPVEAGTFDSPGEASGTALTGNDAYLADGSAGLRVVDVQDPADPGEIGFYETSGLAQDVFVLGDYAYLPEYNDGLVIVDVSNPVTPTLAGVYEYDTTGYANEVHVQGDYAYLADWTGGLRIVDVSDPANPLEVGVYDAVDNVYEVFVLGDYAYVVEVVPNQPYWLRVIDVSDPTTPVEVGALEMSTAIWAVFVSGDYAYVANYDAGLKVVDVSDPTDPVEVGSYAAPDVLDVTVQGDYAYVASADWSGGFLVLDVSDPTLPVLVGSYNPYMVFWPFDVAVVGPYAYAGDPVGTNELVLLDVSDPANPTELEIVEPTGDMNELFAVGSYLYVADGEAGLKIYRNLLLAYYATLGPDSEEDVLPGSSIVHSFTLDNLGLTDSYTLTVAGNSWPTTLLTTSPVTVSSNTSITVTVQVDVPEIFDIVHGTDTFTLTAASASEPDLVLETTGTTHAVTNPNVTLTPSAQSQEGEPGMVMAYTFAITNAGDYTDTFDLTLAGNAWQTIGSTSADPLGPGDAAPVLVTVTIPAQPVLVNGTEDDVVIATDTFTLTAASTTDLGVYAQATGTTHASITPGLSLSGDQTGSGDAGTVVTYTFTLTNMGTYTDSFALTLSSTWLAELDPDTIDALAPDESVAFMLMVHIPGDIEDGEQYTTSIVGTSGWSAAVVAETHARTTGLRPFTFYTVYLPTIIREQE